MGKSKVLIISSIIILVLIVFQPRGKELWKKILEKPYSEWIDVEVYSNAIIVPVIIGGETRFFQFDTGTSTSLSPVLSSELKLNTIIDSTIAIDYYGNTKKIYKTIIPELTIGQSSYTSVKADIIRPIQSFMQCDRKVDGYLGSDFFSGRIVQIDIINKRILLANTLTKVDVENHHVSDMKFISERQNIPIIRIKHLGKEASEDVMFDTGSTNHFYRMRKDVFGQLLQTGLLNDFQIIDTLDQSSNGSGLFGKQKDSVNFIVILDSIEFVGATIRNCPAVTFDSDRISIAGAPFLRYGISTLDFIHKKFYFSPYRKDSIDLSPRFGMYVSYKKNQFIVRSTKDKSLAQKSNIKEGYILKKVNSIEVDSLTECDLLKGTWSNEFKADTVDLSFLIPDNEIFKVRMFNQTNEAPNS